MLRAVLDANVYVSAVLRPEGPPGLIIERFLRDGEFELVVSAPIIEEVTRALAYPKVRSLIRTGVDPVVWFEDLLVLATIVPGTTMAPVFDADADDDVYVWAAIDGRASCVVTGDQKMLAIKEYEGVKIVTPRVFLTRIS